MPTTNTGPSVSSFTNEVPLRGTFDSNGKLIQILGSAQNVAFDPANVAITGGMVGSLSDVREMAGFASLAKKARVFGLQKIRPVMALPPTVTQPVNLAAITSPQTLTPNGNPAFTFDGMYSDSNFGYFGSNVYAGLLPASSTSSSRIEFMTDAPLWGFTFGTNGSTAVISVWINDELTSLTPFTISPDAIPHYVLVDSTALALPRGPYKVRIDTNNQSYLSFTIGAADSVWQVAYPSQILCGWLGDSITNGSKAGVSATPTFHRSYTYTASDLLGWKRAINLSITGTGYINTGGTFKFEDRLSTVATNFPNLNVLVTAGGINDFAQTPAAIQSAVTSYIAKARLVLPNTKLIIVGPFNSSGQNVSSAIYSAIKAACNSAGVIYIDTFLPTQWQSSGNFLTYQDADGVHPTQAGHDYLAIRVKESINAYLNSVSTP